VSERPGVLLLGVDETPALPVIWSLARQNVPIAAASYRRICAGMLSRFPRERLLYPDPVREGDRFVDWLVRTVRTGRYPVTMGCGEEVTYLLSRHKPELLPHTRVPVVDHAIFMRCRDKSLTMKAASECGVPIPVTWYPEDVGIDAVAARADYPAVVKPCIGEGARGISYVGDAASLRAAYESTRPRYGPCLVQEFISHEGVQYKADLLFDASGRVRIEGVYAKRRYYPPTGGSSILNQTVHHPEVVASATRLLTHVGWYGLGDSDFIADTRDGVAKLMEINPRFPRSFRTLWEAGLDYPYELYRLALGEEPREIRDYPADVFLRYMPMDLAWFVRSPERFRARPSFFRFFGKNLHYEEWSSRDPLTGVGCWAALLIDMLDPAMRRARLR
jgi:D-aspartate ligase